MDHVLEVRTTDGCYRIDTAVSPDAMLHYEGELNRWVESTIARHERLIERAKDAEYDPESPDQIEADLVAKVSRGRVAKG